jgi:hypothetical protein
MKRLIKWLVDLFSIKSPCCNKPMKVVGLPMFKGCFAKPIYECEKCKMQWI